MLVATMRGTASWLLASSAAIVLLIGVLHLLYTFFGSKLLPRDAELQRRMREVSPVITRRTTMWKAWIGFNASHSIALILFGAVYGYMAIVHGELLFKSIFLLGLGLVLLCAYVTLCVRYFFRSPLLAVVLAAALYVAALVVSQTGGDLQFGTAFDATLRATRST